jgi:diguanylate cyclase (GGDEF)-like protein
VTSSSNVPINGDVATATQRGDMGLYEWDPTSRELVWDDALAAMFVADQRGELPLQTWLRRVHPDAQDGMVATCTELERAESTYRLVLDDGSLRYVLSRVTQLVRDKDGLPVRMLGEMIDVTSRHEADARTMEILEADLREAVIGGQLVLHYQPQLDIARDAVVGAEALVRWQHPTRGLIYPDAFIGLAEQAGLMKPLTLSVLDQALAQSARWRADGLDLSVAVNVSPSNLVDLDLPDQVADLLHRYGLPTSVLTLEVTEAILMQERERAMAVLTRLRSAGVRISIDDYGTGYSSLAYLAELPVTELKLDRSFVSRIVGDAGVAVIVRSTVDLAHALGLVLVAEGVEDEESLVLLSRFACDVAQGYHLSPPLPADQFTAWLHTREDRPTTGPTGVCRPTPQAPLAVKQPGDPGGLSIVCAATPAPSVHPDRQTQPTLALPEPAQVAATHVEDVPMRGQESGPLPSLLFPAAGIAVIVASRWLPDGPQLALLSLMQLIGAVAVLIGVRRHRPPRPAAWLALAAGGFCFGVGVACWFGYAVVLHQPIPYPGWPDVFFVPAFLCYLTGLVLMIGRRSPARQSQALLDALILAVGLAFANWVLLSGAAVGAAVTAPQTVITVVYPLIDVVGVGVVVRLLLTGAVSPALWLVAAGMGANLVGDSAYSHLAATGRYEVGALPDQLWMLAMVLVGAAALHPSMRSLTTQVEDTRVGTSRLRLALLFASLHVPVAVLAVSLFSTVHPHPVAVVITLALIGPLTALRIQQLTRQLRTLSMSDKLTGLVSRELLVERLERRRHRRHTSGQSVVLFIDLDRFKAVNDTFGHQVGDDVLVLASKRLQHLTSTRDTVSRLGGDEFVIVVEQERNPEDTARLAQSIVDSLAEPFHVEGQEVSIGASVGITTLDDSDPATVLRRGDTAMYQAKAEGRSGWAHYTPDSAPRHGPGGNQPTQALTRIDARVPST